MLKLKNGKNPELILKLNYNNQLYEIPVEKDIKVNELRQGIFSELNLNNSFILTYKNQKIGKNDLTPLYILFKDDQNPLLFINDSNTILPNVKSNNTITLNSKLSQQNLLNIINSFFISKNIPFNASIKNIAKGIYNIKFNNSTEKNYSPLSSIRYKSKKTFKNILKINKHLKLPKIKDKIINKTSSARKIHKFNNSTEKNYSPLSSIRYKSKKDFKNILKINKHLKLPKIKDKIINKTSSVSEIVLKNDKSSSLNNVINENSKSDFISKKIIESGFNKLRQENKKTKKNTKLKKKSSKRRFYINEKHINEEYEGLYNFPYMSEEEKYSREKFLDKKNWINKSGFIVSVGKYTMKSNNFIPNYVHATPSEPPLNHKFREIDKNKWINKSGFYL